MADPYKFHTRRSIRLQDYDYTREGVYFITICSHEKRCLFGRIDTEMMELNRYGKIVQACWDEISNHYPQVDLDYFVVMPNHIHGIFVINEGSGMIYHATTTSSPTKREFSKPIAGSISTIIGTFKAGVTRQINRISEISIKVWQRNYYERIIRTEEELMQTRHYIITNPQNWKKDSLFNS